MPLKCQDTRVSNLIPPPGQPQALWAALRPVFPLSLKQESRTVSPLRSHLELSSTSTSPLSMHLTLLASSRADSPTSQDPGVICSSTLSCTPSRQPNQNPQSRGHGPAVLASWWVSFSLISHLQTVPTATRMSFLRKCGAVSPLLKALQHNCISACNTRIESRGWKKYLYTHIQQRDSPWPTGGSNISVHRWMTG